jgi:hypothetical protein
MKTAEEIKKGLECCKEICNSKSCPYWEDSECHISMRNDAIAYIKQLEAERDAAVKCIGKLAVILKTYPYAATNCCAYEAYKEIKKYIETVRGVHKEE